MIDVGLRTRQAVLLLIMLVVVTACSRSNPSGLIEIRGQSGGLLDCPSELWQYAVSEIATDAVGSETPQTALALLTPDLGLPPGTPQIESETAEQVVFVFNDLEGHRLGRVGIGHFDNGWFIAWNERCG